MDGIENALTGDFDEARHRALSLALDSIAGLEIEMPLEYMRAWLSLISNGEFDALTSERYDH
jgi:hypothetical protein